MYPVTFFTEKTRSVTGACKIKALGSDCTGGVVVQELLEGRSLLMDEQAKFKHQVFLLKQYSSQPHQHFSEELRTGTKAVQILEHLIIAV